MIKVSQTGVGTQSSGYAQIPGADNVSIQTRVTGTATYTINARLASDAPWVPASAGLTGQSASLLTAVTYFPEYQLEVTAGTGTVEVWVEHHGGR